jgi:mannose-1-phosphate guanylyltransferase
MKAMILAAGLGVRLRPLSERRPKVLAPVANIPVLGRAIEYLKAQGVAEIVANAHHHHRQVLDYLDGGRPYGIPVRVLVEPDILGTGGGIRNTAGFWDANPFIVINGDILTDIDLRAAYDVHLRTGAPATLVLHDREEYSKVELKGPSGISDISRQVVPGRLAFTGIHIIDPRLLQLLPASGRFDIVDFYRDILRSGGALGAYVSKGHYWRDIGSLSSYLLANREALGTRSSVVAAGACLDASSRIVDWAVVGERARIGQDAVIERSVLWEDVVVRDGVRVVDSVVTACREVTSDLCGGAL